MHSNACVFKTTIKICPSPGLQEIFRPVLLILDAERIKHDFIVFSGVPLVTGCTIHVVYKNSMQGAFAQPCSQALTRAARQLLDDQVRRVGRFMEPLPLAQEFPRHLLSMLTARVCKFQNISAQLMTLESEMHGAMACIANQVLQDARMGHNSWQATEGRHPPPCPPAELRTKNTEYCQKCKLATPNNISLRGNGYGRDSKGLHLLHCTKEVLGASIVLQNLEIHCVAGRGQLQHGHSLCI